MKNLKVRDKLKIGFGLIMVFTVFISLISLIGINVMNVRKNIIVDETLTNTEMIWEIRENLTSEQRYEMMAFAEPEKQAIQGYLKQAQENIDANLKRMKELRANAADVEGTVWEELRTCLTAQDEPRDRMMALLSTGTDKDAEKAFDIFKKELKPLMEQEESLWVQVNDLIIANGMREIDFAGKVFLAVVILVLLALVVALAVCALVGRKLTKDIVTPLTEIERASDALARGEFDTTLSYDSGDEFGITCRSIQTSFEQLKVLIADLSGVLEQLSSGNLAASLSAQYPGEMQTIEASVGKMIDHLNRAFGEIKDSADQINAASNQSASAAQSLAQGATEQASSLEELSSGITEVNQRVSTNADNAKQASTLARDAGNGALQTQTDMKQMVEAMNEISETSENIRKVIKVIDDIAFQTNILALNAAVEAARAGAAGKGFAVVADEVRNLAGKSAEAAKNTTSMIETALTAVERGGNVANKVNEAFESLVSKVNEVQQIMDRISEASEEQAEQISQFSTGVDQVASVVQVTAATSEEGAATSQELSGQVRVLHSIVDRFRLKDEEMARNAFPASQRPAAPVPAYSASAPTAPAVPEETFRGEPAAEELTRPEPIPAYENPHQIFDGKY